MINKGYFAILTAISGAITITVSSILYYLAEPFTFTSHWISHLGAGPNGASVVFTVGLIITCVLALPFLVHLYKVLKPGSEKHKIMLLSAFIASIVAIIGLFINAIWNMNYEGGTLHVSGSTTFFFAGFFMIVFYSIVMLFNKDIPKTQAAVGIVIAGFFAAFLISFLPNIFLGEDLMTLLTSTDPKAGTTRFLEWLVLFAVLVWFFEMGVFTIRNK